MRGHKKAMNTNLCRVCLKQSTEALDINDEIGKQLNIEIILNRHFRFRMEDQYTSICQKCWIKIESFDIFYLTIENAYRHYVWSENIFAESIETSTVDKLKLKLNKRDDIDAQNEQINVELNLNSDDSRENDVEFGWPTDDEVWTVKEDNVDNENDANTRKQNRIDELYTENVDPIFSCADMDDEIDVDDIPLSLRKRTTRSMHQDQASDSEVTLIRSDQIKNLFSMYCDLCTDSQLFESLADAQKHYKDVHNQRGYIKCCNRKFNAIKLINDHLVYHENPDQFKCSHCDKRFLEHPSLITHQERMHRTDAEKPYACKKCSYRFVSRGILNAHIRRTHERDKLRVKCPKCGKMLSGTVSLSLHIRNTHNREGETVCDLCGLKCSSQTSYENHYKVTHTELEKVQCELCQRWFKHIQVLKKHMKIHTAEPATCPHCDKTLSNKLSLASHIRFVHEQEDTHKCNTCGRGFKKLHRLKEHMTIHTGQRDVHKCEFCPKSFRFKSAKYAHRKKEHPREVEEYFAANKLYRY